MSETNVKLSPDQKKARIAHLFEHHKATFKKMGVEQKDYIPKLFYPFTGGERVVSMFTSEMNRKRDVFLENVSPEFELIDEERKLFRLRYNQAYEQEYSTQGEKPYIRYIVPVEELEEVTEAQAKLEYPTTELPKDEKLPELKTEVKDDNAMLPDCAMADITIRDHLAMKYNKPISSKIWLNDLINENQ